MFEVLGQPYDEDGLRLTFSFLQTNGTLEFEGGAIYVSDLLDCGYSPRSKKIKKTHSAG